jgi:hypothetical protein
MTIEERIAAIEKLYADGLITKAERDRLIERAQSADDDPELAELINSCV